jgi:hypothetical protein
MKRFLLLALTAGLLSPIAANAESYKLLFRVHEGSTGVSTSVMKMASKELCEEGKKRVLKKSEWEGNHKYLNASAICLKSE